MGRIIEVAKGFNGGWVRCCEAGSERWEKWLVKRWDQVVLKSTGWSVVAKE